MSTKAFFKSLTVRIRLWGALSVMAMAGMRATHAGLVGEYQTNSATLHLWHFDEASGNPFAYDAVAWNPQNGSNIFGSMTLSNVPGPNWTTALGPYSTNGEPSLTNGLVDVSYSNCALFPGEWVMPCTTNSGGNGLIPYANDPYTNICNYYNITNGAFTWECMVNPSVSFVNGGTPASVQWYVMSGYSTVGKLGPLILFGGSGLVLLSEGGSSTTVTFPLPTSGPDEVVTNQWYHLAVSYSGYSSGLFTMYWTLMDPARTNCDILGTVTATKANLATEAGDPDFSVGTHFSPGNGAIGTSTFPGLIDEVRLSDQALSSNQMCFNNITVSEPPSLVPNGSTNMLVAYNGTLTVSPLEYGSMPVTNTWYHIVNGVPVQVSNPTNISLLTISPANNTAAGTYMLAATNAYGGTNFLINVTINTASFDGLFNSGADNYGNALSYYAPGSPDPHYVFLQNPALTVFPTNCIVWNTNNPTDFNNMNLTNAAFIGTAEDAGATTGTYEYQTTFVLDSGSSNSASLSGTIEAAGPASGSSITFSLNGQTTNITATAGPVDSESFTITNGFLDGSNVLDITMSSTASGIVGYGIELYDLAGSSFAYTNAPAIQNQPTSLAVPYGSTAQFSVLAFGAPTMSYVWLTNGPAKNSGGVPVTALASTNRVLTFVATNFPLSAVANNQYTNNYYCIISNSVGSVTGAVAELTVTIPPLVLNSVGVPIWNLTNNETNIVIYFSSAVNPATATTAANYSLGAGNPAVASAVLGSAPGEVILTLSSSLAPGNSYTLTVSGVTSAVNATLVPASQSLAVGTYPTNVALWLKASQGIVSDGSGGVAQWNDLSINGNNLTISPGAGQGDPLYVTNAWGYPAVRFNTANYSYLGAPDGGAAPSLEITGDMSVFAVVNFATLAGRTNGEVLSKTGSGSDAHLPASYDYYVGGSSSTNVILYRGNGAGQQAFVPSTQPPPTGVPQLLDVVMQGTSVTHRMDGNGNGIGTLSTLIADGQQPLYLGMRSDGAQGLTGDMQELILIGGALSSSDVSNVENYLAAEYNLPTGTNSFALITQQPVASTNIDQNTTLTVPADASGTPAAALQWYDINNVLQVGQTNATLVISNDMASDSYYLVATNIYGSTTSSVVTVTVTSGLNVNLGPPSVTVYAGQSFAYTAQASGTFPFHYQWDNGVSSAISGATNASYTATAVFGSTSYYCTVTNGYNGITSTQAGPVSLVGIATPTTLYQQEILSNNPVAFWRLNEEPDNDSGDNGTIANDYSGGHNGTYANVVLAIPGIDTAADPDTATLFGSYLPTNSYMSEINNSGNGLLPINFAEPAGGNGEFSVEAWVCSSNAQTAGAGIVTKGYGGGGEQFDMDVFGGFRFIVRDASGGVHGPSLSSAPAVGQWYHVVGVFDGANGAVHLYTNGVDAADTTGFASGLGVLTTTTTNTLLPQTALVSIGARTSTEAVANYDLNFNGNIQDVALYNYALSPQQVLTHYLASQGIVFSIAPTNITASYSSSSSSLTLSWPANHTGWTLQAQTNGLSVGISTNWVNVSGSAGANQVVIPVNMTNGTVFYRLIYAP
ncbi:MAG TPA: LamG-like jellyroll fold domain-containing protein [Candidatus Sulfotelmatobacter sp.]|nr:LamG-like jellyroll fold domain-containing protein [Candidatus Sulfotelmatobacter sp.]